jgi:c-di-GMP-binding flagellar brake protein YcgR
VNNYSVIRIGTPSTSQVMIVVAVIIAAAVVFFIVSLLTSAARGKGARVSGSSWHGFYQIARSRGLTKDESDLLKRLVQAHGLQRPSLIFSSMTILDSAIQRAVRRLGMQELKGESKDDLINAYYRLRNKVARGRGVRTIGNTRAIPMDAKIRMNLQKHGFFTVTVNRNEPEYLGVTIPSLPPDKSVPWNRQKVKCWYWRENDAGYIFETKVINVVVTSGLQTICLKHSDKVSRVQKRAYPRKNVRLPVVYSRVKVVEEGGHKRAFVDKKETHWGTIVDISVGGLSVETTVPFDRASYLKVEFELKEEFKVVGFGKVKRIERNAARRTWNMHVQFTKIDKKYRNEIFAVLYNYQTL